jgi:hypothetical protein
MMKLIKIGLKYGEGKKEGAIKEVNWIKTHVWKYHNEM